VAEFDSVIPAGGSGTLTAKIKTQSTQSGKVSKSIAVSTDIPATPRLMLSVTFNSVTAVTVRPTPRIHLNGVEGDALATSLVLHRSDGEKLEITGFESSDDVLVLEAKPVTQEMTVKNQKAVPGDVVVEASVAADVAAVSTNGRVRIRTNHPDAEVIDVTFSLRLRPVIEARPAQVRLILQDGNSSARTALFRIQHNLRGEFKLTDVKPSNPTVFRAEIVDGDTKQQVHTVAVMLQDDVKPGSLDGRLLESLVVITDDPKRSEITIPVLVEPKVLRKPGQPQPAG